MIEVSNMERFALHDGPGIRTTVFLKGCPLHCPWCANPETWTVRPVLMHDKKKCIGCRTCTRLCPACLWRDGIEVDQSLYDGNLDVVKACPAHALERAGTGMAVSDILDVVEKDRRYYEKSGGGLTLSGGEPLLVQDWFLPLMKEAQARGLSIFVETTGNVPRSHLEAAYPYVDGFLFDVKHLDRNLLASVVGADADLVFSNLSWLLAQAPEKVTVRVPVIPGFNQDVLEDILLFAKDQGAQSIHFLPYHSLGKNKWHLLHKPYIYESLPMMDKSDLSAVVEKGTALGLHVQAGG